MLAFLIEKVDGITQHQGRQVDREEQFQSLVYIKMCVLLKQLVFWTFLSGKWPMIMTNDEFSEHEVNASAMVQLCLAMGFCARLQTRKC